MRNSYWLPIVSQHPKQRPLCWPALGSITIAPPNSTTTSSTPPNLIQQNATAANPKPALTEQPTTTTLQSATTPSTANFITAHQSAHQRLSVSQPSVTAQSFASPSGVGTSSQNLSSAVSTPALQPSNKKPSNKGPSSKGWRKWALVLLGLLVVGGVTSKILNRNKYTLAPVNDIEDSTAAPPSVYKSLEDRFSVGDRAIITEEANYIACPENNKADFNKAKRNGTRAMRSQQYETATKAFEEAWSLCPAPEVLIYRNNARIANKPSHTLAVVVPINWPNPKNAIEMLRGAAQSQTLINRSGGINGVPIKLMVIDDGDKPDVGKSIAATLIDDYPDVLAVIGHWTSGVTTAAASVYDARRSLVFMTPVSTTRDLNGDTGWVFRSTINMRDAQKVLAKYAISTAGYQKVATFSLDSAKVGEARALYSEGLQDEFAMSFANEGGEVVNNFDLGSPDFQENMALTATLMIRQAMRQGAEAVLLIPDNSLVPNAEALIQEADKQGLGLLGVTNLYRGEVLNNNCPAIEGLTMTIAWTADGPANPEFVRASSSREFWRGEVNFATAMTYNATQAIAAAMEKSPTRMGIHTALNRDDFAVKNTADAEPLRFQDGSRTATAELVTVVQHKNEQSGLTKCEFTPVP
ncbi:MAG: ABC transporter substrate-binding protein [Cyanobacteria bacterium J06598_3]